MSGIIAVQTGLQDEANIIRGTPSLQVLCGAAQRDALGQLVTGECKGLVSFGVCGGLVPKVAFGDVLVATGVRIASGEIIPSNTLWTGAIMKAVHGAVLCPFYSDPSEEAESVAQRQALAASTGAWAVDEETKAVAQLAQALNLPWVAIRSPSDIWNQSVSPDTSNTTNPDGSTNIGNVIADILAGDLSNFLEDAQGFNQSLDALRGAFKATGPTFAFPFTM